jgi:hypothetical protein
MATFIISKFLKVPFYEKEGENSGFTNLPINIELCIKFEKMIRTYIGYDYPIIRFFNIHEEYVNWFYPFEDIKSRDEEYDLILKKFGINLGEETNKKEVL